MNATTLTHRKTSRTLAMLLILASVYIGPAIAQLQTVTIDKKNITLNEFLSEIRKQTGYDFVFTSSKLDFNKKISPNFKDVDLIQVLDEYFNIKTGIIFIIKHQTIVFIDEDKADYRTIQGQLVSEDTKQPIQGATIAITERNIHTQTDNQGKFVFNIPEYVKHIIITNVGFTKKIVPLTPSINYRIELHEKPEAIEDVLVTGIFNRDISSFTGAAMTISGSDLKKITSNNIFTAISAYDPAFRVLPNNQLGGNINQIPEIQLRGQNSFPNINSELSSNPNQPLFVLDGFEVTIERVIDLDMNMIASITLLKDASATAIYGSRGANGIMVINTISPKPGKVQVILTNDFRLSRPNLSVYNYLNAVEKLDFELRSGVYDAKTDEEYYRNDVLYNERLKNIHRGINTNWKEIPTQVGYNNRTSLNLQGGDNHLRYGLLAASDMQQGVMRGQDRKNYSGQFDLTYLVNKLQFKNSIRVFQNLSNESPYGNFSDYLRLNPYLSPYDNEGLVQRYLEEYLINNVRFRSTNPLFDAKLNSLNQTKYLGFTNSFQIRYNILKNLYIESNLSLSRQEGGTDQFFSASDSRFETITDPNQKGTYTYLNTASSSYESITTLNYNLSANKHQLFTTAAFDLASSTNKFSQIIAEGFPYDRLDNLLFAYQYQTNGRPAGDESTMRRVGFLYSSNYSYDNRFLADLSLRNDGSSQYGTAKRFGTFLSTGLGWNIHNEHFFLKNDMVNRFKIRSSYGTTGSLNIPAYSSQTRYGYSSTSSYYGELGAIITNLGNPTLSWQNVYKLNIGLDLTLFKERLDLRFDVYQEITKNSLTRITLAPSTGFSNFSENLGVVQNRGLEFSTRYKIIDNKANGIMWGINLNGFTNRNTLKELSNKLKASNDLLNENNEEQRNPNILFQEGESMDAIYVVRSLGVDPATGSEIYLTKEGLRTFVWNAADKVAYGVSIPKWNGNFGSNFLYKGFELGLLLNFQFGGQLYNQTLIDKVESVNPNFNVDRRAYDLGWTAPGDISQFTRIGVNTIPTRVTSRFVQDNNLLTISSLSISYNFYRSEWLKRVGLQSLAISGITNDLYQWSSIEIERGTSNPFARTYSFSIRLGI